MSELSSEELINGLKDGWGELNHPSLVTPFVGQDAKQKMQIQQKTEEIRAFLDVVLGLEHRGFVLETGLGRGGTHLLWRKLFERVISIEHDYHSVAAFLFALEEPRNSTILWGSSINPSTVHKIETILAGQPLDVLFIDGNHDYEFVKQDFINYSPMVREGGIIAFHDTVSEHGPECFVDELRTGEGVERACQIVDIHSDDGPGISYYVVKGEGSP